MIVRGKYPDYLMHYGRSIKDGAPGVGTGNWRRDGSMSPHVTEVVYSVNEYMARERYKQNKPKSIIRRAVHNIKERINESKKSSARKFTDKVVAYINEGFKLSQKYGLPNKEVVEATQDLDRYKNLNDQNVKIDFLFDYADRHAADVHVFDRLMREKPERMKELLNADPKKQTEYLNKACVDNPNADESEIHQCLNAIISAKSINTEEKSKMDEASYWIPKNKEQAKNINDYRNSIDQFQYEGKKEALDVHFDSKKRMAEQALKDIGWETTPKNINRMERMLLGWLSFHA